MSNITKTCFSAFIILLLNVVFSINTSVLALDLEKVVAEKHGYKLTSGHILAFFAFLQNSGNMGDDPTELEINEATQVARQTFMQNPKLFVTRMQEVSGVKALPKQETPPKTLIKRNSTSLQQEVQKLYPQYQLKFQSADINTLFGIVNGFRFSSLNSKSMRSGDFSITTDLREDIHFCSNGMLYMVDYAQSAGGGSSGSFLTGTDGGEISVKANWSLAQLPNTSLILILKMEQSPATLLPILSDRVNIQLDSKVFSSGGKAGC